MRRRRFRLWTLVLTLTAVTLIVAVVAVSGFRFLVKAVPGYRDDAEQRISAELDRRVTIRGLDLSWRRFRPSLDLLDVTLYGDDGSTPALRLGELSVGLDWFALLTGQFRVAELRLARIALTVERLADGSLKVSGISTDKPLTTEELRRIVRAAKHVGRLTVADSQLLWLDYTDPNTFHRIDDIDLSLDSSGRRHLLRVRVTLPVDFGGSLQLTASARGDLEQFEQLETEAELLAQDLQPGPWLQPWLREAVRIEGGNARIEMNSHWKGSVLVSAQGELSSGALQLSRAGHRQAFVDDLQSEIKVMQIEHGWRLALERLSIKRPNGKSVTNAGTIEYRPATEGQLRSVSGNFTQLHLDELGEWLSLFDLGRHRWLAGLKPVGELRDLRFQYSQDSQDSQDSAPPANNPAAPDTSAAVAVVDRAPSAKPQFALQGSFQGLGISPEEKRPGFTGLNGHLQLTQEGGEVVLAVRQGQLLAPKTFDQPFPVTELTGGLVLRRDNADWQISTRGMRWHGPGDLAGTADLDLQLFATGSTPRINLDTHFASKNMDAIRPFIPHVPTVLHEGVRDWLHTAIRRAQVSEGRVQVRGLLSHFPYQNLHEPGLFRIDFEVRDGLLEYAPDWPAIDGINTHVAFQGRTMRIDAKSGLILGNPVGPVTLEVKDFFTSLLEVDGVAEGDAGKLLSFLPNSPLRKDYAALVEAIKLQGPAKLNLRLDIPLDQLDATRVAGLVTLDGKGQLNHAKLPEPITGIAGEVRFDNSGLTARNLSGHLLGLKLALQMDPELEDGQRLTRLSIVTETAFPRDEKHLSRLVPASLLKQLQGQSQWQAGMLFDNSAKPSRLRLSSDLKGMTLNLPPPFVKAAADTVPVSVSLDPSGATGMRADIRYGHLLRAALQLKDNAGRWSLERGRVRLGEGEVQLPRESGLWLEGGLPELDINQWREFLATNPGTPPAGQAPAAESSLLHSADLRFGRLLVSGQAFENIRLQLAQAGSEWLLSASAPSLEGTLRWPLKPVGRYSYRAELQRLSLRALQTQQDKGAGEIAEKQEAPLDPASLPGLSLRCRSLRVNEHDLGQLQIEAQPAANGLTLSSLSLSGDLEMQGNGRWMRQNGQSSAQLSFNAKGKQLKKIFEALGYEPSLEAERVKLEANLAWAPHASGVKTEALGGGFKLDLERGVLMAVEPGAGRILGLLNFFVLPRRLTLDFRDVISKGLAFDTLKGDFRIEQGNAWTDNLKIRGPSLQMEIEGRVGLVARDYDQKVTIHPQVSTGVALAGTLAGGPAVGLALLVAQKLFKKPLESMSELSYRLHGPWDNPTIDKGG